MDYCIDFHTLLERKITNFSFYKQGRNNTSKDYFSYTNLQRHMGRQNPLKQENNSY